jgi:hypothetical protein
LGFEVLLEREVEVMTRQPLKWQALILGLGLGACAAGSGTSPAIAQGEIVYEKKLDLSVRPPRSELDEEPRPVAENDDAFYETPMRLRGLSRMPVVAEAPPGTRIVGGVPAQKGTWLSTVYIRFGRQHLGPGGNAFYSDGGACGATLIDPRWALTAAHCVFEGRLGGLKTLKWVTIHEGSHLRGKGARVRVSEVFVHRQYKVWTRPQYPRFQLTNDIALLKLERSAKAPRQKLAASSGRSQFLGQGNKAKIVGWGDKAEGAQKGSEVLLEAVVPIIGQAACHRVYPQIGDVAFCAGDLEKGKIDTCQGDSGGPLFVAGNNAEHLQAGITSFGEGCARAGFPGVYTDIGRFEKWIKDRVPSAYFALPPSAVKDSPLDQIAGAVPGGPPAPHGQVTTDITVHPCDGGPPVDTVGTSVNRVKVGSCITVHVTSGAKGKIAVFNTNAVGKTFQMFPNKYSGGKQAGQSPTAVRAGQTVTIPGPADGFEFGIKGPLGRNEIIAIVVPEGVDLEQVTKQYEGMTRSIDDFKGELAGIARMTTREVDVRPRAPRAVGTRQFLVVQ